MKPYRREWTTQQAITLYRTIEALLNQFDEENKHQQHMSHHESDMNPESIKALNEMFGLGATGEFPQGKLVDRDEGELKLAIAAAPNKVLVSFGKPIAWIGFSPEQAIALASSLIENAKKAKGTTPNPSPTLQEAIEHYKHYWSPIPPKFQLILSAAERMQELEQNAFRDAKTIEYQNKAYKDLESKLQQVTQQLNDWSNKELLSETERCQWEADKQRLAQCEKERDELKQRVAEMQQTLQHLAS